ncbi:MAG: bifunctional aspartate kinase/homoserine dehydrogenase I [Patescibacteria group bacterium]|nr:bifunctional aspartate kinase/homoserine dehydrogenase I [Patescibacteria group bacterium]
MITKILKFGGSSVGTPEMIKKASKIVVDAAKKDGVAVVVSAFQGITDQLLRSAKLAAAGDVKYRDEVVAIKKRHIEAVKKLIKSKAGQEEASDYIKKLIGELSEVLEKVFFKKEINSKQLDLVASFGERFSAFIISGYIKDGLSKKSYFVDARELVKTDDNFVNAAVDFSETNKLIKKYFKDKQGIPVITGFLGSTKNNETATLGRGGSDYSAAIFGAALGVKIVEIWTDVDGILSADPKLVKNAVVLKEVSYEEAVELAYFGAKVIHPATMLPAVKRGIPIVIKNTFNPAAVGTFVLKNPDHGSSLVRGITSIEDISLVIVGGVSLIGIPGSAARVFDATRRAKANVILISQASSEHTICLAIKTSELEAALDSLKQEFKKEIENKSVSLGFISNQAIIAIVGDNMRGTPGISGRLFKVLGDNKINISAIAQGGSERNISLTVESKDKVRALNLIHDQFVFGGLKNIFLVGTGNIGGTLLKQINELSGIFRVCGIINDKKMILNERGIDLKNWKNILEKGEVADFEKWIEGAQKFNFANKVFVDCTASEFISKKYIDIAEAGFGIVSPNKKFNVLPMKDYKKLREVLGNNGKKFLYETNVGAALPVISTLRDIIGSGDRVERIEGIFSGTLSYIFNNFGSGVSFSEIVAKARKLGYTEPDPREDLSGQDVGRKLLILAREIGLEMEFKDVKIESLVPEKLRKMIDVEKFMEELRGFDGYFKKMSEKAERDDKVLRYVAKIYKGRASAKLEMVSKENPLAHTSGADNIFAFYTKRYKERPLVVQGPGAGAEVTAGGVLADILRI